MNDINPLGATCPLNRDPEDEALEEAIWTAALETHTTPCESGWTGDRCTYALFHPGPHSNE